MSPDTIKGFCKYLEKSIESGNIPEQIPVMTSDASSLSKPVVQASSKIVKPTPAVKETYDEPEETVSEPVEVESEPAETEMPAESENLEVSAKTETSSDSSDTEFIGGDDTMTDIGFNMLSNFTNTKR